MVNPESVQELLTSDNFGDRIKGLNQLRQLPPHLAFPPGGGEEHERYLTSGITSAAPMATEG